MFKPVIGLEVHIEQNTNSKLFCGCPADHFGRPANTQVCPICLGLPGALPYVNKLAIENTIKFGLSLNCEISKFSKFDRKHYFYPDLPKAYQISQYDLPLCKNGEFMGVHIRRIHLEEDTAKLQHGVDGSVMDFNRSSVPLMEMVTEPEFDDVEQVAIFLKNIQKVIRYLGISTADMEKGSMRLEANLSLSPDGSLPDYKVELKNINSFRFLKKAIEFEIKRQTEILEKGEKISQETRGFDEKSGRTVSQRSKEEANDYRYFPEPDVPPMTFTNDYIDSLKTALPELPLSKIERYQKDFGLSKDYSEILTETPAMVEFFESAAKVAPEFDISVKTVASFIINQKASEDYVSPEALIKKLYEIEKKSYASDSDTKDAVIRVVTNNAKVVEKYKNGQVQVIGFLIGQVQRELKGQGNPKIIQEFLTSELH